MPAITASTPTERRDVRRASTVRPANTAMIATRSVNPRPKAVLRRFSAIQPTSSSERSPNRAVSWET
jgi:hypothetical protein